ncbi:hypothetical protein [Burkholderia multivorans]|uniref:hypothetical protein n=1 Tax=Burkholderia multivorans TaxID=87883 RepID=UPI0009E0D4F9|nr:hypothetical protein [Burkholderia multivorans]SAJ91472.1 hypothetical protein UA11_04712 [Burkholderia multivorans]SAK33246.1 hypothetical protein UA11_01903 [Burkholderia multivorans]
MAGKYEKLDELILREVGEKPISFNAIFAVAAIYTECRSFIAAREPFRVLDGRLQALRKAGKIRSTSKGWVRA